MSMRRRRQLCARQWFRIWACCLTLPLWLPPGHAAPLDPPREEADEFHFVVLGDAQFDSPAIFNRIIDQTRRLRPAFVIQVGDLIDGYNSNLDVIRREWQRFARQIGPLGPIRYFPVPGNHDLYNGDKQPDPRLEALFVERWGPLHFAFRYKNALLVGLNSDAAGAPNRIAGDQRRWLEETLAASDAEHKFVFMHRPPLLMRNFDSLHKLFVKHNVGHVFYGHHHHYHHVLKDGIHYSMTNATGDSIHDLPQIGGFRHLLQVSVRGAEVDVAVIEADAVKPRDYVFPEDNYDLFELKRNLLPATVNLRAAGGDGSYSLQIPLRNTSRREVQLFVTCSSADERWAFKPQMIEPLTLAAGARGKLELEAGFAAGRRPESTPVCTFRLPFQTRHGAWFDINLQTAAEGFSPLQD